MNPIAALLALAVAAGPAQARDVDTLMPIIFDLLKKNDALGEAFAPKMEEIERLTSVMKQTRRQSQAGDPDASAQFAVLCKQAQSVALESLSLMQAGRSLLMTVVDLKEEMRRLGTADSKKWAAKLDGMNLPDRIEGGRQGIEQTKTGLKEMTAACTKLSQAAGGSRTVTKDKYNKIANGQAEAAVVELMGSPGEEAVRSGDLVVYAWGSLGQSVTVTFINGVVVAKAKMGL